MSACGETSRMANTKALRIELRRKVTNEDMSHLVAGIAAREVLFSPPRMGVLRKKLAAAKNRGYCIHSSGAVNAGISIQCSGFTGPALVVGGAVTGWNSRNLFVLTVPNTFPAAPQ